MKDTDEDELVLSFDTVLESIAEVIGTQVEEGKIGAFAAEDERYDGYYLVQWTGAPYVVAEDCELASYNPPIKLNAGELVCEATYMETVNGTKNWWYPVEDLILVRLQQVLAANLDLSEISEDNPMPRGMRAQSRMVAREKGAKKIENEEHDKLLDEIARRQALNYIEETDDDDRSGESSNEEGGSDESDSSDDDNNQQEVGEAI
jgi:hypothetical protein